MTQSIGQSTISLTNESITRAINLPRKSTIRFTNRPINPWLYFSSRGWLSRSGVQFWKNSRCTRKARLLGPLLGMPKAKARWGYLQIYIDVLIYIYGCFDVCRYRCFCIRCFDAYRWVFRYIYIYIDVSIFTDNDESTFLCIYRLNMVHLDALCFDRWP